MNNQDNLNLTKQMINFLSSHINKHIFLEKEKRLQRYHSINCHLPSFPRLGYDFESDEQFFNVYAEEQGLTFRKDYE